MKFGDYLKNRDPQLAQSLTEGWFGNGLDQNSQRYYDTYKADIDNIASGQKIPLKDAIKRHLEEEPARTRMANMKRDQGLRPNDLRAAPNLGREGPVTPFNVPQRQRGTL